MEGFKGALDDVSGVYTPLSDSRLKENLEDIQFTWDAFNQLKPLTYSYIHDDSNKRYIGMIAQDVQKIYPELISYSADDDIYTMDYAGFGVIGVKAIQEQQKVIENQQVIIGGLQTELNDQNLELQNQQESINQLILQLNDLQTSILSIKAAINSKD